MSSCGRVSFAAAMVDLGLDPSGPARVLVVGSRDPALLDEVQAAAPGAIDRTIQGGTVTLAALRADLSGDPVQLVVGCGLVGGLPTADIDEALELLTRAAPRWLLTEAEDRRVAPEETTLWTPWIAAAERHGAAIDLDKIVTLAGHGGRVVVPSPRHVRSALTPGGSRRGEDLEARLRRGIEENRTLSQRLVEARDKAERLLAALREAEDRAATAEQHAAYAEAALQRMMTSRSWRATAPVRSAVIGTRRLLTGLRRRVRRPGRAKGPMSPAPTAPPLHQETGGGDRSAQYEAWMASFDYDPRRDRRGIEEAVARLDSAPLISVVMPVRNPDLEHLRAAIESVLDQIYPRWELCIAGDASADEGVRALLSGYAVQDPRIKVAFRPANGTVAASANFAFELAEGEWTALLDRDGLLREHALAEVALALAGRPDAQLLYSDEDTIDAAGHRFDPFFKPDYAPDLLRGQNYFNRLTVHRAANIRRVGGWRLGFEGNQDYDLTLRIVETIPRPTVLHVPKVLYHRRAAEGSTAWPGSAEAGAGDAGLRALAEHVERSGLPAQALPIEGLPFYRVRYEVPTPAPLVSLIIPTKDRSDLLRVSIGSILAKTTYAPFEIVVVDNGSRQPETFAYLEEAARDDRVRVIPHPGPFNYSAINNHAVREAKGSVIALVNNDVEVITPEWLTEMVSQACRPEIGCVGAKLYYPDDVVQHAGVILGIGGVAGHSHKRFPRASLGYFARLRLAHNVCAVTGACLVVRRAIYEQVGGLDESRLAVAFNDVDFCLKVREAGYLNLVTPFAELYHHESVSRGFEDPGQAQRYYAEARTMILRWGPLLTRDPYYSPHLTLETEDFSIRTEPLGRRSPV